MSDSEDNTQVDSPSLLTSHEDKENAQVDSPSMLTSLEDEENEQENIATVQFNKAVMKYLHFLLAIARSFTEISDDENQKQREKRKFLAIKKELRNFLIAHENFYYIDELYVEKEDCSVVFKERFEIIFKGNEFLRLEDILKLNEICFENGERKIKMCTEINKSKIFDTIKLKQGKSVLTTQDIHQFFKNHLLIEKKQT